MNDYGSNAVGRLWPIVIVAILASLQGCALQGGNNDFETLRDVVRDAEGIPTGTASFHILAGELAAKRGQSDQAAAHYVRAMRLRGDAEIAARATRLSLMAGNFDLALESADQWVDREPANASAHEIATRLAVRAGDADRALRHARAIVELHPGGVETGLRSTAMLLATEGEESALATDVMRSLVDEYQDQPSAHYALGVLALRLGDLELASAAVARALEIRPGWSEAHLLQAGIQVQSGDLEAADSTMRRVLSRDPGNISLRMNYARLLLEAERADLAAGQYQLVLKKQPRHAEALYALGLISLDSEDVDSAHGYFLRLFRTRERDTDAAYYLGRIEEQRGNYPAALQWYSRVTSGSQALDATLRRAFVLARLGNLDEARAYLADLRVQNPQVALRFYLAEGDILYEAQEFDAALEMYDTALQDFPDEADLLYGRALISEKMGRVDLAEQDLRRILDTNPEEARSLNALGYILANHSSRYDEARSYITRALEMTPGDPAVMDSMGWVQFRLGQYAEAQTWLEQAWERVRDPEIAAHLGELYWVQGRFDDARAVWDAGLAEEPGHPVLTETIQRLTQ